MKLGRHVQPRALWLRRRFQMVTASVALICVGGVVFMVWFLAKLCQEQRIASAHSSAVQSNHSQPGALLGATHEYQEAVLRWPLRQIDSRTIARGRNRWPSRVALTATLRRRLQHVA